jgi:hypothetical protein
MALEYVFRPSSHGSGSSDAVAALIGALWWIVVSQRRAVRSATAIYASYFAVSLLALRFGGPVGSAVVGAALAATATTLVRQHGTQVLSRLMLIAIPAPAFVLVVLLDSHGIGIATGTVLGALLSRGDRRPKGPAVWRTVTNDWNTVPAEGRSPRRHTSNEKRKGGGVLRGGAVVEGLS